MTTTGLCDLVTSEGDDGTTHPAEQLWTPGEEAVESGFVVHRGLHSTPSPTPRLASWGPRSTSLPPTPSPTPSWPPSRGRRTCRGSSLLTPGFRDLWNDRNVGALARAFKVFVHPGARHFEPACENFDVRAAPGQELLVGSAEPGSRSAQALTYVASMAAPRR